MTDSERSYIEVGHYPIGVDARWSQDELLLAAQKSVCRNTGWPVGIVLTKPEFSPKPVSDGIRAVIRGTFFKDRFDFWSLSRRGYFYFLRQFEEDSDSRAEPGSALYFDTRIWRIAEVLLHCANLYHALDVDAGSDIRIQIAHRGLSGRKLQASDPIRSMSMSGRISHEDESEWVKVVPLGAIEPNLQPLVGEISSELFMLFEFWRPDPQAWGTVLQTFLRSRV